MIKKDLIQVVSQRTNLSKATVSKVFESIVEEIQNAVACGETVTIAGWGKFFSVARASRRYWSPFSQKFVQKGDRRMPAFTPGKHFKKVVLDQAAASSSPSSDSEE